MKKYLRMLILIAVDVLVINAVLLVSFWLRFDGAIPAGVWAGMWQLMLLFTVCIVGALFAYGLHNRLWEHASIGEVLSLSLAVTIGVLLVYLVITLSPLGDTYTVPRSIYPLTWALNILFLGFSRMSLRILRFYMQYSQNFNSGNGSGKKVLIAGAGDAGSMVGKELKQRCLQDPGFNCHIVGYVDDDVGKVGRVMHGSEVLGVTGDIPELVKEYGVEEVIIAIPSVSGTVTQRIVDLCYPTGANVQIVPGLYELIDGKVNINQIREVKVHDLLNREPVKVDLEAMSRYLEDQVVLVSGAGGSIGAELSRQAARFNPARLILLDHNENGVHKIHEELVRYHRELDIVPLVADVKEKMDVSHVFDYYRPEVVFHAAAYKHVPLMEHNPERALRNNILGTWHLGTAAKETGAHTFVLVSTDKAVDPSSVMGATKRIAEMLVENLQEEGGTCFAAVRFGNVLNSRGSVVPIFKNQIARGGPVTVTHPEMTRYFMTIPEAVQLIIQAGALAEGGEKFILDMGEPVKIQELAEKMIKLAGFTPGEDIEIVYNGVRPGEKLEEELFSGEEKKITTSHSRIYSVYAESGLDSTRQKSLEALVKKIGSPDWYGTTNGEVFELLRTVLPEFCPAAVALNEEQVEGEEHLAEMAEEDYPTGPAVEQPST